MTDPRKACANKEERLLWALIHDGLAHPFMAVTGFSRLSLWFHDWTSHKAWPRKPSSWRRRAILGTNDKAFAFNWADQLRFEGAPHVVRSIPDGKGGFRYEVEEFQQ